MNAHAICSHEDNAASSDPSPHPRLCCVSFGTCEASYSALAGGAVSGSSPANNTVSESQDRMDRVRDASRTVEQSAIAPSECQTVSSPLHRRVGQNVDSASAAPRRAQSSPHDSSPTPLPVPPATMQRKTPMTPSATPSTCSPPPHTAPHVGAWAKMHNYDTVLAPCVRGIDARKGAGEAESVDTMDSSIGSSHMSNATATMITAIGSNATATANRMVDTSSEAIAAICVKEMYAIRTESVSLARLPSQSTASDSAMRLPVKRARSGEDEHDKEDNDSTPSSSLSSSQAPTAASLRTSPNTMGCSSIHTVPALPETRPTTHTIPVMWCPESTSLNKVPKLPKRVLRWTKMLQDVMSQEQQQQQQQQSEETTSEGVHAVCQRIAVSITGNEHEAKDTFLTLLVHLRDPENHLLRRRVLSGEIAVERLLGMAEHDLVNPERRRKMDLQFEERARDRNLTEMANAVRTTSRLFPCPACKARDCSWVQRQTRSGDEPMTIFYMVSAREQYIVICSCKLVTMKIMLKWFSTGKLTPLSEEDEFLNVDTTIAEVKAFIQLRFGFAAKQVLLLKGGLLENDVTLRSVGLTGNDSEVTLIAHVIHSSELEGSEACDGDVAQQQDDDGRLHEFSHADFLLAMKMIGKDVAVPNDRLVAMRTNPPRQRPALLRMSQRSSMSQAPLPSAHYSTHNRAGSSYDQQRSAVYQILANLQHGKRRQGVDRAFCVRYSDTAEPFDLWDLRPCEVTTLPESQQFLRPGELCVELFYFGEYSAIADKDRFKAIAKHVLEAQMGVRIIQLFDLREAGCIYPLVGLTLILHELDARELGESIFEDFGRTVDDAPSKSSTEQRSNPRDLVRNGSCLAQ